MAEQSLVDQVSALMKKNRRTAAGYTYTVPSPEHYPFQWFWDSSFHVIILSYIDPECAKNEILSVLARPLANGLIPHMIYWDPEYMNITWGREKQGDILSAAWGTDGVSSITQPPVIATAVWHLHTHIHDVGFLREIYPALRAHYVCLLTERSLSAHGLLGIINPDESGEDNSPRFDAMQGLPEKHTPAENLSRRIARVREHVACKFDVQGCTRHNFWIEDVTFNAICLRAIEALALIAREIGELSDFETFTRAAQEIRSSMLLHMGKGYRYYSLQGESQKKIRVETWGLFMPLYAGLLSKDEAQQLIEKHLLNTDKFYTHFPVPSVSFHEGSYTDDDLWRGPTWVAINWFIYKGLVEYGYTDLAQTIKEKTIALLERSGFREFYNAQTGEGHGAHDFTWGGLVLDMH